MTQFSSHTEPKPDEIHKLSRPFADIWHLCRGFSGAQDVGFRLNPWYLAFITLIINILSLALPLLAMQIYDRIIARGGVDTLHVLTVGVAIAILLEAYLKTGRAYMTAWLGAAREHWLFAYALEHSLRANLRALQSLSSTRMMQHMESIGKLREFYSGQAIIALIDMPFILVFFGLIVYLGGPLALVPLVLSAIFTYRAWRLGIRLKREITERDAADAARYQCVSEMLSGIHTIKSYAAEDTVLRWYEQRQKDSAQSNLAIATTAGDAYNDGALFTQLMIASVLLVGAVMTVNLQISMGALIACMLLSGRMVMPIQRALSLWVRYQDLQIAKDRLERIFSLPVTDLQRTRVVMPLAAGVELENLQFRHQGGEFIVNGVNLTIASGEAVAIHGDSGCGKTTLLKLVAGIHMPDQGLVRLGDVPIEMIPSSDRATYVGYLATNGGILQGSLRDNLSGFGRSTDAQMKEIAQHLGLAQEIARLPLGYDTEMENTPADPVPPGLKQRVAIARVLALKPRVILFDNADRALDKKGYNQIYRLLARLKGRATLIIVSEDANLLQLADMHYQLERGALSPTWSPRNRYNATQGYRELRL